MSELKHTCCLIWNCFSVFRPRRNKETNRGTKADGARPTRTCFKVRGVIAQHPRQVCVRWTTPEWRKSICKPAAAAANGRRRMRAVQAQPVGWKPNDYTTLVPHKTSVSAVSNHRWWYAWDHDTFIIRCCCSFRWIQQHLQLNLEVYVLWH